jgi:hypothetical protein
VSGLANIEVPRGRLAVQAWRRLDRHTRRDVTRYARRGIGHPDPQVAAIAVGRAQATLRLPLRRWALVVVASLLVNWLLAWALGRLLGGLDVELPRSGLCWRIYDRYELMICCVRCV